MTDKKETIAFKFDVDIAISALLYLADRPNQVTELDKYKAGKLLFLADKYHVVRYGRPIFGDTYFALPYGPIPSSILNLIDDVIDGKTHYEYARKLSSVVELDRQYEHPRIRAAKPPDLSLLSESDREALEYVIMEHGKKSFAELMALTHAMAAYRLRWDAKDKRAKRAVMHYEDFFEEEALAVAGVRREMIENAQLRKRFPAP
jgi:uncharacterized phage-associated protein